MAEVFTCRFVLSWPQSVAQWRAFPRPRRRPHEALEAFAGASDQRVEGLAVLVAHALALRPVRRGVRLPGARASAHMSQANAAHAQASGDCDALVDVGPELALEAIPLRAGVGLAWRIGCPLASAAIFVVAAVLRRAAEE